MDITDAMHTLDAKAVDVKAASTAYREAHAALTTAESRLAEAAPTHQGAVDTATRALNKRKAVLEYALYALRDELTTSQTLDATATEKTFDARVADINAASAAYREAHSAFMTAKSRLAEAAPEHQAAVDTATKALDERQAALDEVLNDARNTVDRELEAARERRAAVEREIVDGPWSKPLNELISDREALLLDEQSLSGLPRAELNTIPERTRDPFKATRQAERAAADAADTK